MSETLTLKTAFVSPHLSLNNRLVMPPMASEKSMANGQVTDELCQYYATRAQDGCIGLIITEHCYIHPSGKASPNQLSICKDQDIPGLTKLTQVIHRCGSKVVAQISHAGSAATSAVTGMAPIGPSQIPHPRKPSDLPVQQLTAKEILQVKQWFVDAAFRAKQAGYDGVEIHAAHGYLLNQFFSPLTNNRTDQYGGSVKNRIMLAAEIVQAIKEKLGSKYPVLVRLGGCDYHPGGSTIQDCVTACSLLKEAGADIIDLTGGMFGYNIPQKTEPGFFSDMSTAVKSAVNIPVILTGGIKEPHQANALLQQGAADLIGVGRALLANATWAIQAMQEK